MSEKPMDSSWLSKLAPSDRVVAILLIVVGATFTVRLPAVPRARPAWLLHIGVLLAFIAVAAVMALRPPAAWVTWLRAIATIAALMLLSFSLGAPVPKIMPSRADPSLARVHRALL